MVQHTILRIGETGVTQTLTLRIAPRTTDHLKRFCCKPLDRPRNHDKSNTDCCISGENTAVGAHSRPQTL